MRHVADREDVDQRADARDQQHEADGQLVKPQTQGDLEPADVDPLEDYELAHTLTGRVAEHLRERGRTVGERQHRHGHAEQVPPRVSPLAPKEQDDSAE